jgi:glycosyltransferase involved in cell wall biosynthesis
MRVLVYPHTLEVGGAQLNAIELAGAMRDQGHDVVVFGQPGVLTARVAELGLEFVAAPDPHHRPSRRVVQALVDLVDERGIEVLHGHEWPPALECLLAARRRRGVLPVATVASMAVAPFIPATLPLLVGTEQIEAFERARGRSRLGLLEPPVDTAANSPGAALPVREFRERWGLDPHRLTVVSVARLVPELKLEGLLTAMEVVGELAGRTPTQLLVVGDGPARDEVRARAAAVNERAGAGTVVVTGELFDPRPAYACADVALGMGGSALRAMAFATPLIVQGERGFWRALTPETADEFFWTGWYGYGDDTTAGPGRLREILGGLLADAGRRAELGAFARRVVEERYALTRLAERQAAFYAEQRERPVRVGAAPAARAAGEFGRYQLTRRARRLVGLGNPDSPAPVAALPVRDDPGPAVADLPPGPIVYQAGVAWDAVVGTDRHLARALSRYRDVVWVDPPVSVLRAGRDREPVTRLGPTLTRVRTVVPPGVTRFGVRRFAAARTARHVRRVLAARGEQAALVVATGPDPVLRYWPDARRVHFATDDFVAGAALLGCSARYLRRARRTNLVAADVALAVSAPLARVLELAGGRRVGVLHNGCDPDSFAGVPGLEPAADVDLLGPVAGVLGQLNERLDLDVLEALADSGESLLLCGPRCERDPAVAARIDALIARANVQWVGRRAVEELPRYHAAVDVGLTPYTDTAFNRASFPLKTLEYLAAGRPVVASDLPATRALGTELVTPARGTAEFVQAVRALLKEAPDPGRIRARQAFARAHSWDARAAELLHRAGGRA